MRFKRAAARFGPTEGRYHVAEHQSAGRRLSYGRLQWRGHSSGIRGGASDPLILGTGTTTGTVSFAKFGTITVDPGATWSATGSQTIASDGSLADDGTLTVGSLVNAGQIAGSGRLIVDPDTISNSGTITTDRHARPRQIGFSQSAGDTIQLSNTLHTVASSQLVNGGADTQINLNDGSTILLKGVTHIDSSFFS